MPPSLSYGRMHINRVYGLGVLARAGLAPFRVVPARTATRNTRAAFPTPSWGTTHQAHSTENLVE